MGPRALMEFKCAIYDGLEMKLKVSKNATSVHNKCSMVQMMMKDETVLASSVLCLLDFSWKVLK